MDRNNRQTGSAMPGEPVYLAVGKIRKPHGVTGELVLEIITDFPERFNTGKPLFVGEDYSSLTLKNIRPFGNLYLIMIDGVDDRDKAGEYRNQYIYVKTEDIPELPEGEYYHHQLLGLSVVDDKGKDLGTLTEILETGANDVYVISNPEEEEILVPALSSTILGVDLVNGVIKIKLPEWE